MKKASWLMFILLVSAILLAACSNDDEQAKEPVNDTETETNDEEDEEGPSNEADEIEDQLELTLGDTGVFDSPEGTYEMTVNQAELLGKKFEGVESTRDDIILLDITVTNTSEEQLLVDKIMDDMEVTDDLDEAGSGDNGIGFESIDPLNGSLEAGEEMTGHFLTTVNESKTYHFRRNPEVVKDDANNQVIWNIKAKDLEE